MNTPRCHRTTIFPFLTYRFCLLLTLGLSTANAEIVTIEVAIKSVDAKDRTITASRKDKTLELDVSKRAEVVINGKVGKLDALAAGQKANIDYETTLEIVTKIEATGEGTNLPAPELVALKELNTEDHETNPWLSADGLTIYWNVNIPPQKTKWVWTANRPDTDSLFDNKQRLLPGSDPTVSIDGLEMILLQDGVLCSAVRDDIDKPFQRPKVIKELGNKYGFLAAPCLSSDGLTLYYDWFIKGGEITPSSSTRKNKSSEWSVPHPLEISGAPDKFRNPSVSHDGKTLYSSMSAEDEKTSNIIMFRKEVDGSFKMAGVVDCGDIVVRGFCPRFVPNTHELFFAGLGGSNVDLMVVKNYSP